VKGRNPGEGNGVWRWKEKLNREEWGGRATWWCTT